MLDFVWILGSPNYLEKLRYLPVRDIPKQVKPPDRTFRSQLPMLFVTISEATQEQPA
jgi:hypothetical protein